MYKVVQDMNIRAFGFPREYVQGPGALSELPHLMMRHGHKHALAIVDGFLIENFRQATVGSPIICQAFAGECTMAEAERLAAQVGDADLIIGMGGGKCIDTAKAVSILAGLPFFSLPSIASNDAPTSRLVVLYDADHSIVGTQFMRFNPDLVLVDTDVIARAPLRFLRAGIGDALTKMFETRAVQQCDGQNFMSSRQPYLAGHLGRVCFETVIREAPRCLEALEHGERPKGFEELVEALILVSGLAFESGGLSVAHSMTRGLTRVPAIAAAMHGEQVAYGVLVQLVLEGDADMLARIVAFNRVIGLPTRLADFGIAEADRNALVRIVAEGTMTAPYLKNFSQAVSVDLLIEAMIHLETLNAEGK